MNVVTHLFENLGTKIARCHVFQVALPADFAPDVAVQVGPL